MTSLNDLRSTMNRCGGPSDRGSAFKALAIREKPALELSSLIKSLKTVLPLHTYSQMLWSCVIFDFPMWKNEVASEVRHENHSRQSYTLRA